MDANQGHRIRAAIYFLHKSLFYQKSMSVTLHTSHGDVKVELFCDLVPKTCEVSQFIITNVFSERLSLVSNFV
jgi:hypothetical protein